MRGSIAWVTVLCGLGACSNEANPGLELLRVVPGTVTTGQVTPAVLEGRNFFNTAEAELDDDRPPVVYRNWKYSVGDGAVVDATAEYVDTRSLRAAIPAGLPVGVHDVTITAPDGAEDTLEDGLTVTAGLGGAGGEGGAGAFRAPVPIPALLSPTSADDDPSVTEDLCDLFFASNRPGGLGLQDIWTSHRAAATDPWGAPTPVVELNSASTDALPGVAPNGLTIFFSSSRPGTVGLSDIWVATRADRYASWSEPLQATELNTVEDDLAPWVSFNGLQMVLTSTRAGGPGGRDLYWTTRVIRTAPWGEPTLIPGVNGVASDSEGRLARDGLALFFSSTRGGDGELYLAERLSLDDDFSTPAPITELSTLGNEADPWPSADGSYLLFSSDVSGSTEIYETSR